MKTTGKLVQQMRWVFSITVIIFCFNLTQHQLISAHQKNFPIPDNLKSNVEFWKNVYTLYNQNQIIIHDAENLDIIYEIFDANKYFGSRKVSEIAKWREVENVKKKYQKILQNLAKQKDIQLEQLAAEDRFVYNLFLHDSSPQTFQRAAQNIRGQQGLREYFRQGIIRSGKYLDQIKQIFNKYDLPVELMALPHVESSFNYKAYSKYGAAGMWQFTRRTGRRFLKINYTLDERFDPIKSTEAAAKLLKYNYEKLGSWPLAITAYNHGVYGMLRAVSRIKSQDLGKIIENYKSRSFKFASRNFYAEFLAAREVEENYKIYFGELALDQPEKYLFFEIPNYIKISTLARRLDLTIDEIKKLNPSLRRSVLSSKRRLPRGYNLKIPFRKNFSAADIYANIPNNEKFPSQLSTNWYQVQMGDNLFRIADQFKTSISELITFNEINNPDQIYAGQIIKIKSTDGAASRGINSVALTLNSGRTKEKNETSSVAIEPASGPHVEDKSPAADYLSNSTAKIIVQPDETLGHFADWLKLPTQEIRNLNKFGFAEEIHLAQEIEITFRNVTEDVFNQKRFEFHCAIEEDFFATFKINEIKTHRVKKGDNIWKLCNELYEIPYWLIIKYNPDKDLLKLKAGDLILVPIIETISNDTAE